MNVISITVAFIAITAHALPTPPSDAPDLGGRVVDRRININSARRPPPKVRTLLADAEIFDNPISWGTPFSKRDPAQNAPAIPTDGADDMATAYSADTLDTAGTTTVEDTRRGAMGYAALWTIPVPAPHLRVTSRTVLTEPSKDLDDNGVPLKPQLYTLE